MPEEAEVQRSARFFEQRVRQAFEAMGYFLEEPGERLEFDFLVRRYEFPFEIRASVELKYFERDFVPASIVFRSLDIMQRYKVDKAIVVTTLGFTQAANELAEKSDGKIALLTEAELIERIPGKRKQDYYDTFLRSSYVLSALRDYFELVKPDYTSLIAKLPRSRLCELLSEFASPQEFADFIAEKIPKDRILMQLEEVLEPTQIKEILAGTPKKAEISVSRKREIEQTYNQAKASRDPNEKGKLLEQVISEIFELVPSLKVVGSDVNDGMQEIDIQLRNHNHEHIWAEFEGMIFVECKNWSEPVGANEIDSFRSKLERNGLHSGILVAIMGVTGSHVRLEGAWGVIKMALQNGRKIIVLDGKDLDDIFKCADISEKVDEKYVHLYKLGSQKS